MRTRWSQTWSCQWWESCWGPWRGRPGRPCGWCAAPSWAGRCRPRSGTRGAGPRAAGAAGVRADLHTAKRSRLHTTSAINLKMSWGFWALFSLLQSNVSVLNCFHPQTDEITSRNVREEISKVLNNLSTKKLKGLLNHLWWQTDGWGSILQVSGCETVLIGPSLLVITASPAEAAGGTNISFLKENTKQEPFHSVLLCSEII